MEKKVDNKPLFDDDELARLAIDFTNLVTQITEEGVCVVFQKKDNALPIMPGSAAPLETRTNVIASGAWTHWAVSCGGHIRPVMVTVAVNPLDILGKESIQSILVRSYFHLLHEYCHVMTYHDVPKLENGNLDQRKLELAAIKYEIQYAEENLGEYWLNFIVSDQRRRFLGHIQHYDEAFEFSYNKFLELKEKSKEISNV